MLAQIPSIIAASCVSLYWLTVAVKCIRIARIIRKDPNVIPRERTGQLMRLIWAPLLATWIVYPWLHLDKAFFIGSVIPILGAITCLIALTASYYCWREMGTSWRIGIDPDEKTEMIVSGPYHYVRHPIYALSILLVWGSLMACPSLVMLLVALFHSGLMLTEARREEKHMLRAHGQPYADYMKTAGRFIPRF